MLDLSYIFNDMTERTEERKNRFNGESVMLTKEEAAKHDAIFINELAATLEDKAAGVDGTSKKGVPYYVYYDLDAHGYRTANTSWKVRH